MMGWVLFALLALASALLLWRTGFPKRMWTVAATALMLGAAGYAWQGQPALAGRPVLATDQTVEIDPNLVALRDAMFGRFNFSYSYFIASDAMKRAGLPQQAAWVMVGAVRKSPQDAGLWTGLGAALAEHDGNQISPGARFAFEKAEAIGPKHPGPPFFHGLALVREGKFAEARPYWAKAVALTPEKASYRPELMMRLFLLDRYLAGDTLPDVPEPTP
ncbi:tetratricopeptide repeat protein [Sphingomonas sp. M1-B02]|uniref:tetratricopeptide repeat protein n=1 Tax=Sphingomonas sp. M1-B02 TaxID=3114300 RepID=UPI00223EF622|nr:cytochrome c biogenesis factor-like protein [Sphingomonas sp. S6-11]UZK66476.1 cytochrome c biogenesis factor-like protein [Sphingomonas sp. S6-11]